MGAQLSPDGSQIAWNESRDVYRSHVDHPVRELVCRDCGLVSLWLPEGSALLISNLERGHNTVTKFDLATGKHSTLLASEDEQDILWVCSVSPRGEWMIVRRDHLSTFDFFVTPFRAAANQTLLIGFRLSPDSLTSGPITRIFCTRRTGYRLIGIALNHCQQVSRRPAVSSQGGSEISGR